jgi:hypothetical protein
LYFFHIQDTIFCGDLSQSRKRKKKADKSTWKREQNKKKRMQGEQYLGFIDEVSNEGIKKQLQNQNRDAKQIGPTCSSGFCAKSKFRHCDRFNDEMRIELFNNFWMKMDWGQKKAYVGSLVDIIDKKNNTTNGNSRRNDTMLYYLKLSESKVQVCCRMFLSTLGITYKQV